MSIDFEPPQADPTSAVANPGAARPPLIYAGSILVGLLLHAIWPLPLTRSVVATRIGVGVALLAIALFISAVGTLRSAGTPVPGNQPTTRIVRAGPYRFSRNPIYLAFSALHVGIALALRSPWLLATLVLAWSIMAFVVIPREERYLEARFPSEYSRYKASVRRWL